MNIYKEFNEEERNLISKIEKVEDRDYSKDETKQIENSIIEDIIRRSSKNGDIQRATVEYSNILDKFEKINF